MSQTGVSNTQPLDNRVAEDMAGSVVGAPVSRCGPRSDVLTVSQRPVVPD
jgi:hypothetical protein